MLLQKGEHIIEETNGPMIEYYKQHGYVEVAQTQLYGWKNADGVEVGPIDIMVTDRRKGKKDQPPADLASLADDLSKDGD